MKRLSVLLASGALVVSAPVVSAQALSAPAGNWSKLAESATGSIFSLDLDSIESSDISIIDEKRSKNITVSIRITYPTQKTEAQENNTQENNAQESNAQATKDNTLHHSYQQLLLSCKNTSYYRRAYVNYDTDNKVIKSWQSKKPILTTKDFTVASPKTMGRMIIDRACKDHESAKQKS